MAERQLHIIDLLQDTTEGLSPASSQDDDSEADTLCTSEWPGMATQERPEDDIDLMDFHDRLSRTVKILRCECPPALQSSWIIKQKQPTIDLLKEATLDCINQLRYAHRCSTAGATLDDMVSLGKSTLRDLIEKTGDDAGDMFDLVKHSINVLRDLTSVKDVDYLLMGIGDCLVWINIWYDAILNGYKEQQRLDEQDRQGSAQIFHHPRKLLTKADGVDADVDRDDGGPRGCKRVRLHEPNAADRNILAHAEGSVESSDKAAQGSDAPTAEGRWAETECSDYGETWKNRAQVWCAQLFSHIEVNDTCIRYCAEILSEIKATRSLLPEHSCEYCDNIHEMFNAGLSRDGFKAAASELASHLSTINMKITIARSGVGPPIKFVAPREGGGWKIKRQPEHLV